MKRPLITWLLPILHLLISLNALVAGFLMLIKPNGSLLKMEPGWLEHSPFRDYLIPGLILFLLIGGGTAVTFTGLLKKNKWKWPEVFNLYEERYWAWTWSLYMGIILLIWITFQLIMTKYFWLQPVIIFMGLGIIIVTLFPRVMKYYMKD